MSQGVVRRGSLPLKSGPDTAPPPQTTIQYPATSQARHVSRALVARWDAARRYARLHERGRSFMQAIASATSGVWGAAAPARALTWRHWLALRSLLLTLWTLLADGTVTAGEHLVAFWRRASDFWGHHRAARITTALVLAVSTALVFALSFFGVGYEVFIGGQSVGFVAESTEFDAAVARVSTRASEVLQRPYVLSPVVTYQAGIVERNELFDAQEVENLLFSQIDEIADLSLIEVGGEIVGGASDAKMVQGVLDEVLARYPRATRSDRVNFADDVRVVRSWAARSWERSAEELTSIVSANTREELRHMVAEGDSWESVAVANGMSVGDLQALNPTLETLTVGDNLLVLPAIPYLSIEVTSRRVYNEEIPFEIEYVDDADLYKGDSEIRVAGVPGEAQITADITTMDGKETGRVELDRVILQEPVTQIVAQGTTTRPPTAPTGTYIMATNGVLTSNYGYRSIFGGRQFHTGIDLANRVGTPIYATDGGTVIYSGWQSGYGNTIIINHGKGIVSLYGHSSKLLVSKGDKVAQGQQIAKMGSTGRSTGSHLHLEFRVDGQHVTPWRFLK